MRSRPHTANAPKIAETFVTHIRLRAPWSGQGRRYSLVMCCGGKGMIVTTTLRKGCPVDHGWAPHTGYEREGVHEAPAGAGEQVDHPRSIVEVAHDHEAPDAPVEGHVNPRDPWDMRRDGAHDLLTPGVERDEHTVIARAGPRATRVRGGADIDAAALFIDHQRPRIGADAGNAYQTAGARVEDMDRPGRPCSGPAFMCPRPRLEKRSSAGGEDE